MGFSQERILEWVAISFSRGSFQLRDQTWVSCIGRQILYCWASREALFCSRDRRLLNWCLIGCRGLSFFLIIFLLATPLFVPFLYLSFQIKQKVPAVCVVSRRRGWSGGGGLCWPRSRAIWEEQTSNNETFASFQSVLPAPCLSFCILGDKHFSPPHQ